jgi:hypothetical protein
MRASQRSALGLIRIIITHDSYNAVSAISNYAVEQQAGIALAPAFVLIGRIDEMVGDFFGPANIVHFRQCRIPFLEW